MAFRLNEFMSGGYVPGVSEFVDTYCEPSCPGPSDGPYVTDCIELIDCFNNGGTPGVDGCDYPEEGEESCHTADFCSNDYCPDWKDVSAGSSRECNAANKSDLLIPFCPPLP